ncbi:MAG: GTP cyclohydrolase II [Pseudomonadota bacterium]
MTQPPITFDDQPGDYFALSNLYPRTLKLQQQYWHSAEHYYQAQQFIQTEDQEQIRQALTPQAARHLAHTTTATRRTDWEQHKTEILQEALYAKFKYNDDLNALLLDTADAPLHYRTDTNTDWGITPDGKGANRLGELLMTIRTRLRRWQALQAEAKTQTPWMSVQKDVPVPTDYGTLNFNVYMDHRGKEHVAIIVGQIDPTRPILTRIHSECLTGDLFRSLKCDCGEQLEQALRQMQNAADSGGGGILLYMRDEGRGIGLGNKLRAYRYQAQGLDTEEANEVLGLPVDARSYHLPAAILHDLGVHQVQLMTNNPAKLRGLAQAGIQVVRQQMASPQNAHNADYLATKNNRMGHDILIEIQGNFK